MKKGLPRPIVLNQSSVKTFINCQRLYAWQRLIGLQPYGRRSALEIGTSVHLGLSVFHGGGINVDQLMAEERLKAAKTLEQARAAAAAASTSDDDTPLVEDPSEALDELHDELTEAAKLPLLEQAMFIARKKLETRAGPSSAFADKDLVEALDIVNRVLPAYVKHWEGTGEIWHPLNQEIEACVEVGDGTNIFLRFKADNLSSAKGGLYLVDYKTAGRMDPRDLAKYELDIQLSAYIYGLTKQLSAEAALRGEPPVFIRGAIIDVLVKTQTPQFVRELYTRSIEELQEFEAEWIEYSSRIREQEDRVAAGENFKIVFPKNTEHCFKYGTCPFHDICVKDTPIRRKLYDQKTTDYVDEAAAKLQAEWLAVEGKS
jgi:hypothetical protein